MHVNTGRSIDRSRSANRRLGQNPPNAWMFAAADILRGDHHPHPACRPAARSASSLARETFSAILTLSTAAGGAEGVRCTAPQPLGQQRPALPRPGAVLPIGTPARYDYCAAFPHCRCPPLEPIARCLQRWPCELVARIGLQSRCRPKW